MESVVLAASKRRINLSMVVRKIDAIRFALAQPMMSFDAAVAITGVDPEHAVIGSTAIDAHANSCGWFGLRTCSQEYFRDKINTKYRNDPSCASFWAGAIAGYRHGIILGQREFMLHAESCLNNYAVRIVGQLGLWRTSAAGIDPSYITLMGGHPGAKAVDAVVDLLIRSPQLFPDSDDPVDALLQSISDAHGVNVCLGDYIISSDSEQAYWSHGGGWVRDKDRATAFERSDDVFVLPGINGSSKIVSYQSEPQTWPSEISVKPDEEKSKNRMKM